MSTVFDQQKSFNINAWSRVHRSIILSLSRRIASRSTGLRLTLQRHFSGLAKFALVESRFCGRKRRGKAAFDVPANPCVRSVCSRSVAV